MVKFNIDKAALNARCDAILLNAIALAYGLEKKEAAKDEAEII